MVPRRDLPVGKDPFKPSTGADAPAPTHVLNVEIAIPVLGIAEEILPGGG